MANSENKASENTGNLQREIQQQQDQKDQAKGKQEEKKEAMQAGTHAFPTPPLPSQHLDKPGIEAGMQLKPQFMAPDYCGSGKLQGMTAIITGGDSGIGRAVAVLYAREGADVALVYLSDEQEDAVETKRHIEAEGQRCILIPGDVRDPQFCRHAVEETVQADRKSVV